MKSCKFALSGAIVATLVSFATHEAQAQVFDKKVMPGNACQAVVGSQGDDLNHYAPYLQNFATTDLAVSCPIVRDNSVNTNATYGVAVTGFNAGGTFSCTLYSYDNFGNFQDLNFVSTSVVGNFTLGLEDPLVDPLTISTSGGIYSILCTMTPESKLFSYRWAEWLSTDLDN